MVEKENLSESGKNRSRKYFLKQQSKQIEDMAMLCSNCHRMVHRIRPWIFDKNELKSIIRVNYTAVQKEE